MKTVQDQVLKRIRAKGRGAVHVPADFLDLGGRAAVDQALEGLIGQVVAGGDFTGSLFCRRRVP